jgi:LacI family gluconate utilization system Gnt-I transcriptional repressor
MSRVCRSDDNRQDIETRFHILSQVARAASALDYVPNRLAGTLAGAASRQVGVILPSLSNIVFADVLKGLEDRLEGGSPPRVTNVDVRLIPGATA